MFGEGPLIGHIVSGVCLREPDRFPLIIRALK